MLEASLSFLSTQVADFTVAGHRQEQFGNQAISRKVTANLFVAKNSYLLLAVNDERQYRALMTALGRADVLDDPRFSDWFQRKENEAALRAIIEAALAAEDAKTWEKRLNDAGAKVLHHHVGARCQALHHLQRRRLLQVQREAAFVTVHREP